LAALRAGGKALDSRFRGNDGGEAGGFRSGISSACGFPKQDFWFALEIFFCPAIDSPFHMDKMDSRGFMEMFVFSFF
jgi:hypothetical protein